MTGIEWHGDKAYGKCRNCNKLIRVNKSLLGSLHVCVTDCERIGGHLDIETRRVGLPWKRWNKRFCNECGWSSTKKDDNQ